MRRNAAVQPLHRDGRSDGWQADRFGDGTGRLKGIDEPDLAGAALSAVAVTFGRMKTAPKEDQRIFAGSRREWRVTGAAPPGGRDRRRLTRASPWEPPPPAASDGSGPGRQS